MKEDERLYLEFLQNNISRMNTNSVQTKGWCVAIVAALLAIFADTNNLLFVYVSLIPIILFCILDAFYLLQEHKFIAMYNSFIKGDDKSPKVYEMPMKEFEKGFFAFLNALKSWSVLPVYGLLFVLVLLINLKCDMSIKKQEVESSVNKEIIIQEAPEDNIPEMILRQFE